MKIIIKAHSHLEPFNSFTPIAVETSGVLGAQSKYFLKELGYHLRQISGEERSYSFRFEKILLLCKEETLLPQRAQSGPRQILMIFSHANHHYYYYLPPILCFLCNLLCV